MFPDVLFCVRAPECLGPIHSERFLGFVWRQAGRALVCTDEWRRERPLVIAHAPPDGLNNDESEQEPNE